MNIISAVSASRSKRYFSVNGSLLLPLALKWRLVGSLVTMALAVLVLPCATSSSVSAASLTIDVPDTLSLSVTPDGALHKQTSGDIKITSDAFAGYTFTLKGDESQQLKNGNSVALDSITEAMDEADYKATGNENTWAYLPNKLNSEDNTKFQPGPTADGTLLDKTEEANNANTLNSYTITLGAKVDTTITPGTYTNTFTLMVTANEVPYTISYDGNGEGASAPQPTTGSGLEGSKIPIDAVATRKGYSFMGWCSVKTNDETCGEQSYQPGDTYTLQNSDNRITLYAMWVTAAPTMQNFKCSTIKEGETVELLDNRDDNTYKVRKLKDGLCWMIENLRLGSSQTMTLTDQNTDLINSSDSFDLPASSKSGFSSNDRSYVFIADGTSKNNVEYGGYYSWYAATAGTGTRSIAAGEATSSICPKGWRLPTGGPNSEFQALSDAYGNNGKGELLDANGPNFLLSGQYINGNANSQGSYGYYWSSTSRDKDNTYYMYLGSSSADATKNYSKYYGKPIRCVSETSDYLMQTVDQWGDSVEEGQTVTAIDARDGNAYNLRRLKDGNLWMTQNLRLGGDQPITLTPANTDVSSDWDLPGHSNVFSSYDDHTPRINTSSVGTAVDDSGEKTGVYYNWYAATAGTGTRDMGEGQDAPDSVCPKGWRLPTGGYGSDYATLYDYYDSLYDSDGLNLVESGSILGANVTGTSRYWTSTAATSNNRGYSGGGGTAYYDVNNGEGGDKGVAGYTIRCVEAKDIKTTYEITYDFMEGEDGPNTQTGTTSENRIRLSSSSPTRTGYEFAGWCTSTTNDRVCSGRIYRPGVFYPLTSGAKVTLYAIWSKNYGYLGSMQSFSCSELPGINDYGTVYDTRDGSTYKVRKLADGKCWMTDNLKIAGKTLTSYDSDLNGIASFDLPASNLNDDSFKSYDVADVYVSPTGSYGGYYSWYAATAGTGTRSIAAGEATSSICPKGWRLPSAETNINGFKMLLDSYSFPNTGRSSYENLLDENGPAFLLSGYYYYGSAISQGSGGRYWSSTSGSYSYNAYGLNFTNTSVNLSSSGDYRFYGKSVRCLAE